MSHGAVTPPQLSGSPAPLSPASSAGNVQQQQNLPGADPSSGPMRRKPSRRANTAERRATHNAVERQRRETLNGRFLDLAALLPNLAAVRRPSKSAIVNSSIALVHTQRRQRALAGREVRALKIEIDRLRAEVNDWRVQANVPRDPEPQRSAEFHGLMVLEEVSLAEEEEIKRAYEMAAIRVADDDDDGYGDVGYDAPAPQPQQQPHHQHHVPQHMQAPPPPMHHQAQQQHPPMHHGYGMVPQSAPPHITHHQIPPSQQSAPHPEMQAQLHAAAAMMHNSQQRPPPVHIPAFDGPSMFPGPGHHNGLNGNVFPQQYSNGNSPGVGGSPPHTGHSGGHFPYGSSRPASSSTSFNRDGGPAPFAHAPPPGHPMHARDDDSVSSSSGGGSPPATGLSQFGPGAGAGFGHHQEVPTLAAGATPADFARFWANTNPAAAKQQGFTAPPPMGFAM